MSSRFYLYMDFRLLCVSAILVLDLSYSDTTEAHFYLIICLDIYLFIYLLLGAASGPLFKETGLGGFIYS